MTFARPTERIRPSHSTSSLALSLLCVIAAVIEPNGNAALPPPRMSYLENGEIRIGMDLALGGAVTFLSSREHPANIINSADLGRQIQMSHYSGPWPFTVDGKKPKKEWAGLGWNPIQTGDCNMNPSRVLEHRNDGTEMYIKCIPMQWPLSNAPGDCIFESWTKLDGPVVHMRYRCTNQRTDKTQYRPCPQELPAVYTISRLDRLMSYTGEHPFTGDKLTHVTNNWRRSWPWTRFVATERWAALVNEAGWGLGVFSDNGGEFHGGIHGDARSDDPKHGTTAYVAPIQMENFDCNIVYEYRTDFVIGQIDDIRKRFNAAATKALPSWRFEKDRQHWTMRDAHDAGLPLKGEWRVQFGTRKPRLESPIRCWRADAGSIVHLEIAYQGKATTAQFLWKRLNDDIYDSKKRVAFELIPDGMFHAYQLNLASSPEFRDLITGLAIEPVPEPRPHEEISIKSITVSSAK